MDTLTTELPETCIEMRAASLYDLYEADEVAWLDEMSRLAAENRTVEMDLVHLSEYLSDMASRDRREVKSRLAVLLTHLLKREFQPDRRSGSWQSTLIEQRSEILDIVSSRTLYNHGMAVLDDAYLIARRRAAAETELPITAFPVTCGWTLDEIIADEME